MLRKQTDQFRRLVLYRQIFIRYADAAVRKRMAKAYALHPCGLFQRSLRDLFPLVGRRAAFDSRLSHQHDRRCESTFPAAFLHDIHGLPAGSRKNCGRTKRNHSRRQAQRQKNAGQFFYHWNLPPNKTQNLFQLMPNPRKCRFPQNGRKVLFSVFSMHNHAHTCI